MNENRAGNADLEQLLGRHALPEPPPGFSDDLMARLDTEPAPRPLWQRPWLQWSAVGLGFGLTLMRLVSYVFGAWLALASAL